MEWSRSSSQYWSVGFFSCACLTYNQHWQKRTMTTMHTMVGIIKPDILSDLHWVCQFRRMSDHQLRMHMQTWMVENWYYKLGILTLSQDFKHTVLHGSGLHKKTLPLHHISFIRTNSKKWKSSTETSCQYWNTLIFKNWIHLRVFINSPLTNQPYMACTQN